MSESLSRRLFSAPLQQVPARVREVIAREQDGSEILIGWIQLGVVCTFAALYSLAPPPAGADPGVAP